MLISSAQALDMLQAHAPRAWCKRLLLWLVFDRQLQLLFRTGWVRESRGAYAIIADALAGAGVEGNPSDPARLDEYLSLVAEEFDDEIAEAVREVGAEGRVCTHTETIDEEPRDAPIGALVFADTLDWETGRASGTIIPDREDKYFLEGSDLLSPQYDHAWFEFDLRGMCFPFETIEMLAPNAPMPASADVIGRQTGDNSGRRSPVGRPVKWDWEGAMAHVVARANHPDGIPSGAGAQAKLEDMIARWFIDTVGDAPAPSEVRRRASKIMNSLRLS